MSFDSETTTSESARALFPRASFDLVAIAASAGGVRALRTLVAQLEVAFPVPIAVVQHLPPFLPSQLSDVLGWKTRLHTQFVRQGERPRAGTVFLAPPDRHLTLVDGPPRFALEDSERLCHVRPAADRLFTTAAAQLGPRLLCVVLTGMGRDGAAGAAEAKRRGGIVIVQDPDSADADAMPRATLAAVPVDFILPINAIASALNSLCGVLGTRELFCGSRRRPTLAA